MVVGAQRQWDNATSTAPLTRPAGRAWSCRAPYRPTVTERGHLSRGVQASVVATRLVWVLLEIRKVKEQPEELCPVALH